MMYYGTAMHAFIFFKFWGQKVEVQGHGSRTAYAGTIIAQAEACST